MKKLLATFIVVCLQSTVSAGTIAEHRSSVYFSDWEVPNDSMIIGYDSGNEWLSLWTTQSTTREEANSNFDDFYIASTHEIRQLFTDLAGLPYGETRMTGGEWINLFGLNVIPNHSIDTGTMGYYDGGTAGSITYKEENYDLGWGYYYWTDTFVRPMSVNSNGPWWMVREVKAEHTPEPSGLLLLAVGILFWRWRRWRNPGKSAK